MNIYVTDVTNGKTNSWLEMVKLSEISLLDQSKLWFKTFDWIVKIMAQLHKKLIFSEYKNKHLSTLVFKIRPS